MPYKPKRPCNCPGCKELVRTRFCDAHSKQEAQRYEMHQRDPRAREWYGKEWRRIREAYRRKHPLCEQCEAVGRLRPAEEVHHILPLRDGGTHEESNLRALCKRCHSEITAREGGRWGT